MGVPKQGDPLGLKPDVVELPPSYDELVEATQHLMGSIRLLRDNAEMRAKGNDGDWLAGDRIRMDQLHERLNGLITRVIAEDKRRRR